VATPLNGLGTLSAGGVGSGLDVNSLVSQLVAADRAPRDAQITRHETQVTTEISGLASLKGALSTFQDSLTPLSTQAAFTPRTASSSNEDVFTATASGSAAKGTYSVKVIALAQAQQLASNAFAAGATATVGTGTLTITSGSSSFQVTIDSSNNTLAGIRDAINGAAGNTGVQATLLNEVNGSRLVLTSTATGAAHSITVTAAGGDGNLSQITYPGGAGAHLTQLAAAQDAHIQIAGFDHYSSSNAVSDAIDGVTLNLVSADPTTASTLSVSDDTSTLMTRINGFVTQYNALYKEFASLRAYSPDTQQGGPLLGDALLLGIESTVSSGLTSTVTGLTGNYTSLASIGITKQADGTLSLDQAKLNAALSNSPGSVGAIFGSTNGVAARLNTSITTILQSNGALDSRNQQLQREVKDIATDKSNLDEQMTAIQARYTSQFSALDALLAQMQQTSTFLTSALANLPKPNSVGSSNS